MPETWSGYLVAMTPLAAVLVAIAHSYWTNRSYVGPLVFSAIMALIGNVMYFLA